MKRYLPIALVMVLIAAMLFSGCAMTQDQATSDEEYYAKTEYSDVEIEPETDYAEAVAEDTSADDMGYMDENDGSSGLGIDSSTSILEPTVDRKVIYTGYVSAQTKNFDEDYDQVLSYLTEVGGYVENAYVYGTAPEDWQDEGRYAEITIRVLSDQFDAFMEMLNGMGENLSSSISGTDISLEYYDTETQLSTLEIREERLQELLEQAAGLEDIILLEQELADVSYEIQMLQSELRNYDSLVDFSTITISLQEVNTVETVTSSESSIGERISSGFYSVLNVLADFGEGLLVFIIAGSPIIIIIAVIVIVIVVLVKRSSKKRKAQIEAQRQQNNQTGGMK